MSDTDSVWQAYQAMQVSKKQHFDYLEYLENKYRNHGDPGEGEKSHLANLLASHDRSVSEFRTKLADLKQKDSKAFQDCVSRLAADASV